MVDPEKFGRAMGEQIKLAIAPLQKDIIALRDENLALKKQLSELPDVAALISKGIEEAVKLIPVPKDGEKGDKGDAGDSVPVEAVQRMIDDAVSKAMQGVEKPAAGKDGLDGKDGEKGADGVGMAGAIIDRDGCLQITLTNGEVKNLGRVEGKDGKDGLSFESFTGEYIPETNEISIKATCAGRTQEIRFPAGGIQLGGYWRDGTKAKGCEAWIHDGSLWIAKRDTTSKPSNPGEDWYLAARKGRDSDPNLPPPTGTIKVGPNKK